MVPSDLGTKAGLITDIHGRVLDEAGTPIAGLYAAGNSASTVMGTRYAGAGATIGPAMVFGFLSAETIAEDAKA
jgi:3-oxosteroid 1-dehydrogenase